MDIEQLAGTILGNYKTNSLLGQSCTGGVYGARQASFDRALVLNAFPLIFSSYPSPQHQATGDTRNREMK
jgi:hypothetical protein